MKKEINWHFVEGERETHLTQQADSIAVEPRSRKEWKPVFCPRPSSVVASMDEDKRRAFHIFSPCFCWFGRTLLQNHLHLKTGWELVKNAALFLLQLEWYSHFVGYRELGICPKSGFWSAKFGSEEGDGVGRSNNCHELWEFDPSVHYLDL